MKVIAIIGARSGSKGVVNKNIRKLFGEPLLGLLITKCLKSELIDKVFVSTDSDVYASIAKKYGAEVPYLRPKHLSTDRSPEFKYIYHMLEWLKSNMNYIPDLIVRPMVTVPFQSIGDIDSTISKLIKDKAADSAVAISLARQHPLKALKKVNKNGKKRLVNYFSNSAIDVTPVARQSYAEAYFRSNIIVSRIKTIYDTKSLTGNEVAWFEIEQGRSLDIDNEIDFEIAEYLAEKFIRG